MPDDLIAVAQASYDAYVTKDRAAIEALIGDDFHFTSPLDNRIDRAAYFKRCWPNSEALVNFRFVHLVRDGERVFVIYDATSHRDGAADVHFRNTEILTIRDGKIVEAEVYFGWTIPHHAPAGHSTDNSGG
jgi:ketosteroid isomerase-like protein